MVVCPEAVICRGVSPSRVFAGVLGWAAVKPGATGGLSGLVTCADRPCRHVCCQGPPGGGLLPSCQSTFRDGRLFGALRVGPQAVVCVHPRSSARRALRGRFGSGSPRPGPPCGPCTASWLRRSRRGSTTPQTSRRPTPALCRPPCRVRGGCLPRRLADHEAARNTSHAVLGRA